MQEQQPQFNAGANSLTRTFQGIAKGISNRPPQVDVGQINGDFSLTINSLRVPVPKDSYSVCRSVLYSDKYPLTEDTAGFPEKLPPTGTKIAIPDGQHTHACGNPECPWSLPNGAHYHFVDLPPKMRRLKPGDKVLVAIVANEFIVIDIIYPAKFLGTDDEPDWR